MGSRALQHSNQVLDSGTIFHVCSRWNIFVVDRRVELGMGMGSLACHREEKNPMGDGYGEHGELDQPPAFSTHFNIQGGGTNIVLLPSHLLTFFIIILLYMTHRTRDSISSRYYTFYTFRIGFGTQSINPAVRCQTETGFTAREEPIIGAISYR